MSYTPVEYGPAEWAVVTGSIASSILFVHLEASGEEAFMDVVGIHENWLKVIQRVVLKAWSERAAVMVCSNVCRGRR